MPRLPRTLVVGSQATWTRPGSLVLVVSFATTVMAQFSSVRGRPVAGGELGPRVTPPGLLVDGRVGDLAQRPYGGAVDADHPRRQVRPRGLVHEWHELVWEPGHGAAEQMPPTFGQ